MENINIPNDADVEATSAAIEARLNHRDNELRQSILTCEMLRIGIRIQKHWPTLSKYVPDYTLALQAVNDVVALSMCRPGEATSRAVRIAVDVANDRYRIAETEKEKRFWKNLQKECDRLKELSDEAAALGAK